MTHDDGRGVLYPARLPALDRVPAPPQIADRVRWFWIAQWQLAPGRRSRQHLLPFAASNLVVALDGVSVSGPTTRPAHRDLEGHGWAVGALLRPAAGPSLGLDPAELRDLTRPFEAPELQRAVVAAMLDPDDATRRRGAVDAFSNWVRDGVSAPDEGGAVANAMEDLIASERSITRVELLAERLGVSTRTVQRLARRYVGLPPLAIIRRYRLQEAAQRLREGPAVTVAQIAAELGYADHAHLDADFRTVLGFTPMSYRRDVGATESSG